jgi:hypothetical protein
LIVNEIAADIDIIDISHEGKVSHKVTNNGPVVNPSSSSFINNDNNDDYSESVDSIVEVKNDHFYNESQRKLTLRKKSGKNSCYRIIMYVLITLKYKIKKYYFDTPDM